MRTACGDSPFIHGSNELAHALVRHPLTRAVGFTGSSAAGRALFDSASSRPEPIPVFAEMSSLNPVFILPGALRERGAQIAEGFGRIGADGGRSVLHQACFFVFAVGGPEMQAFAAQFAKLIEASAPGT